MPRQARPAPSKTPRPALGALCGHARHSRRQSGAGDRWLLARCFGVHSPIGVKRGQAAHALIHSHHTREGQCSQNVDGLFRRPLLHIRLVCNCAVLFFCVRGGLAVFLYRVLLLHSCPGTAAIAPRSGPRPHSGTPTPPPRRRPPATAATASSAGRLRAGLRPSRGRRGSGRGAPILGSILGSMLAHGPRTHV